MKKSKLREMKKCCNERLSCDFCDVYSKCESISHYAWFTLPAGWDNDKIDEIRAFYKKQKKTNKQKG